MSELITGDVRPGIDGSISRDVDEAALKRIRLVGHLLDDAIRVPGTDFRVGLDPILGILPVAGDTLAAALSLYIVVESARLGVSTATVLRMLGNVAVDLVVGSVPVLGDLFDAAWRANRRNVELAHEDLGVETTA